MRSILAYILLIATLLPTFSQWGTIAYYHANKEYIARVLCVNRDKPELHCDGKCYLAQRLKTQQEKQDKRTTERVQNMPEFQLFCQTSFQFAFRPVVGDGLTRLPAYLLKTYAAPQTGLLQPPRV